MLHEKWKGPVAVWATEPDGIGKLERSSNTAEAIREQEQAANDLAAARVHLERRAAANIIICRWKDELRIKLARARLKHELIGLHSDEHDALADEVATFKRLCAAIGWSPSGRRRS
jgi:hypothetical protein